MFTGSETESQSQQGFYPQEDSLQNVEQQQLTIQEYVEQTNVQSDPSYSVCEYLADPNLVIPDQLICREYMVWDLTVTSGLGAHYYPWQELIQNFSQIGDLLSRYTLMRADIRVRIQIVASITTFGSLFVVPFYNYANTDTDRNFTARSSMCAPDAMIMDVSRREMLEFVIPYVHPLDYIPLTKPSATSQALEYRNGFYMRGSLLGTISGAVTPSFQVQIWCNFENVAVAGPVLRVTEAEGHMFKTGPERNSRPNLIRTIGNIATGIAAAATVLGGYESDVPDAVTRELQTNIKTVDSGEGEPIRISPWGNVSTCERISNSQTLAAKRLVNLPSVPLEGPSHAFNLYEMAKIPSLVVEDYIVAASTQEVELLPTMKLGVVPMEGWFPYVLKLFRMWRCSVKVHIRFVCTPMVTARATVLTQWRSQYETFANAPGDLYTQVVSIQGTTDLMFTVPYLNSTHWIQNSANSDMEPAWAPIVHIAMDQMESATLEVPSLGLLVWVSAADDLVLRYPQSPFVDPNVLEAEGHMNLTKLHSDQSKFPSITGRIPPVVDERDVVLVTELLNRFSLASRTFFSDRNLVSNEVVLNQAIPITDRTGTLDVLCYHMCRFTSGAKRFKVELSGSTDIVLDNSMTASYTGNTTRDIKYRPFDGITRAYNNVWGIMEFELPYTEIVTMWPVWEKNAAYHSEGELLWYLNRICMPVNAVFPGVFTSPELVVDSLVAAGSTFAMHVLAWPPPTARSIPLTLETPPVAKLRRR